MCAMGRPCGAYRKGGMKLECNGAARCGYTECYHYKPHAVEEDECEKWTYCPDVAEKVRCKRPGSKRKTQKARRT